ncbi:hypothetical protein KSZ_10140 [Dictyobacter formicarum]|uniref:Tetratricopeptide repeat protein n=1 Tax=Dictyobacter formicarum TaxID=2778368 RepID=A0ABQ3VB15_9CHLR|nr:hypothetical protein KSZ_10140 [Dictyobacter formicarum]
MLYELASYLHARARYHEAELLYQRALHIWELCLGIEHPQAQMFRANYYIFLQKKKSDTKQGE